MRKDQGLGWVIIEFSSISEFLLLKFRKNVICMIRRDFLNEVFLRVLYYLGKKCLLSSECVVCLNIFMIFSVSSLRKILRFGEVSSRILCLSAKKKNSCFQHLQTSSIPYIGIKGHSPS